MQLIPAGELLTEPRPVPAFCTESVLASSNLALTVVSAPIVIKHLPSASLSQPVQPLNSEPGSAVASSLAVEPSSNLASPWEPQSIPVGLLTTAPEPAPVLVTARLNLGAGLSSKVAVIDWAPFIVTSHAPAPEQAPDQPANVQPAAGAALSSSIVPDWRTDFRLFPQRFSDRPKRGGDAVTTPEPLQ